jgi:hypothetical protein
LNKLLVIFAISFALEKVLVAGRVGRGGIAHLFYLLDIFIVPNLHKIMAGSPHLHLFNLKKSKCWGIRGG